MDDTLLHLDDLAKLSERSAAAHQVGVDSLEYERFGICTPDLVFTAQGYVKEMIVQTAQAGLGISHAMFLLFLAGFDLGYQARLELETRETVSLGEQHRPFDQEQDG